MLFHKSLVSLVTTIALAISATADDAPTCSSGSLTCRINTVPIYALTYDQIDALGQLDSNLDTNINVGISCHIPDPEESEWEGWYCTAHISHLIIRLRRRKDPDTPAATHPYCCDGIQTHGRHFSVP
jgi:hypothetical protein